MFAIELRAGRSTVVLDAAAGLERAEIVCRRRVAWSTVYHVLGRFARLGLEGAIEGAAEHDDAVGGVVRADV